MGVSEIAKLKAAYKKGFISRTKLAREGCGLELKEVAAALGIKKADTYEKYEKRTILPHYLVPAFCKVCGISADQLFRTHGVGEVPSREAREGPRRRRQSDGGARRTA